MDLTVLGAGPAYSDRRGSTGSAYLVRDGADTLLLDLGQGSFPALAATVDPVRLGAVIISHLHPDHFIDLVPLRHYLQYECRPSQRVRVHAPAGLATRLDALHDEPGFTAASLDVEELGPGSRRIGQFALEAALVTHTAESYAFRVTRDAGPGLVYSGDCGRAADLVPLVRAGDALLVEVSFGPGPVAPEAQHLDAPGVGWLANQTRPGRVLLTHLQMGFDPVATVETVRHAWDGPVDLVAPGFETAIGG